MDIITIVQAVFRRWYVSLPIVALAAGAAFYVQASTPPAYQAEGQLLLADPTLDPSGLPASVVDLDDILRQLEEASLREQLQVGTAVYQVDAEDQSTIGVTVNAPEESAAEATALAIHAWVRDHVHSQQEEAGFPDQERLQVRGGERVALSTDARTDTVQALSRITLFDPTAGFVNPYVASIMTVRLLIVAVESDAGRTAVRERTGPNVGFLLTQSTRDAAPIMGATTTGPDEGAVLAAFDVVREVVDEELQRRQDRAEIPEARRTRVEALAVPQRAADISPPVERAAAAIFGLGGILAVTGALVTDSVLSRKQRLSRQRPWSPVEDADLAPYPLPEEDGEPSSPTSVSTTRTAR